MYELGGRAELDQRRVEQAVKLCEAGRHTVREIEELTGAKQCLSVCTVMPFFTAELKAV